MTEADHIHGPVDAPITIIVSEETGTVAYAQDGKLHRKIDINTLRSDMLKSFGMVTEEKKDAAAAAQTAAS